MRGARHRDARSRLEILPKNTTARGSLNVALHAHIPWVKRAGRWPFGEEWLFEAMLETYLPLMSLLARLRERGIRQAITLGVTPVLIEMLRDPYLTRAFDGFLDSRAALLDADLASMQDEALRSLAVRARDGIVHAREAWLGVYRRDLLAPMREAAERGEIEIVTSAATHPYLPLIDGGASLEAQLRTGIATTQSAFGAVPNGIWLPECGYAPHLRPSLERCGLEFFYTDARAIEPFSESSLGALALSDSSLAFYVRDRLANDLVEHESSGYPGGPWYREFHKRHEHSGALYWRVTDRMGGLGSKAVYEPKRAHEEAARDGRAFAQAIAQRLERECAAAPHLTLTFDAEFFGHWWSEGFAWLEETLVRSADRGIVFRSPSKVLHETGAVGTFALGASSWGVGGDDRVWLNTDTAGLWVELRLMESQLIERVRGSSPEDPFCMIAARELLLAQSSDWPFQITNGGAATYGRSRFREHRARFDAALGASAGQAYDEDILAAARDDDTCFAEIDLSPFAKASAAR